MTLFEGIISIVFLVCFLIIGQAAKHPVIADILIILLAFWMTFLANR